MKHVRNMKSILMAMSVVTASSFLIACDKNTSQRSPDRIVAKKKCELGFDLNKSQEERLDKIEKAGLKDQVVVRTIVQKDDKKGEMNDGSATALVYLEKSINEYMQASESLALMKNCDTLKAHYKGVGAEGEGFIGEIKAVKKNSITIEGKDRETGTRTSFEITLEQAKINKKSDKAAIQAKLNEELGLGQIKVEMKSANKRGSRHLVAVQVFEKKSDNSGNGNGGNAAGAGNSSAAAENMIAVDAKQMNDIIVTLGDLVPADIRAACEQALKEGKTVAISTELYAKLNEMCAKKQAEQGAQQGAASNQQVATQSETEIQEVIVTAQRREDPKSDVKMDQPASAEATAAVAAEVQTIQTTENGDAIAGTDFEAQAAAAATPAATTATEQLDTVVVTSILSEEELANMVQIKIDDIKLDNIQLLQIQDDGTATTQGAEQSQQATQQAEATQEEKN